MKKQIFILIILLSATLILSSCINNSPSSQASDEPTAAETTGATEESPEASDGDDETEEEQGAAEEAQEADADDTEADEESAELEEIKDDITQNTEKSLEEITMQYDVKNETNPIATITMENGDVIVIELYPDVAPNTVNNFITLANSGYYNGIIFHRVIPNFMIQGGCPDGTGMGGPGYSIFGEFGSNGFENNLSHTRGVVSMARTPAPNSGGSQFFICVADPTFLDNEYAGFGMVVYGMDAADTIVGQSRNANDRPHDEQKIATVTIDTKGVTYPEPEKM